MPSAQDLAPASVAELAALGRLWDEHQHRLLAMLERRIDSRLRQRMGADAILQSTFLDAAREWTQYQLGSPMKPYPWLYGLAHERLIEEYRKHVRPKRGLGLDMPLGDDCSDAFGGDVLDPGTGPLTAAQRAETTKRVERVLELLPAADREILTMSYFDQLSTNEICDVLNARNDSVSEGTLNVRLSRARVKMQRIWKKLYGALEPTR